jgi:hypothetical protein
LVVVLLTPVTVKRRVEVFRGGEINTWKEESDIKWR